MPRLRPERLVARRAEILAGARRAFARHGYEGATVKLLEEETGLSCRLEEELTSTRYRDNKGRDKVVRYWAMSPESGTFVPHQEVDEVRWIPPATAPSK